MADDTDMSHSAAEAEKKKLLITSKVLLRTQLSKYNQSRVTLLSNYVKSIFIDSFTKIVSYCKDI